MKGSLTLETLLFSIRVEAVYFDLKLKVSSFVTLF